MHGNADSCERLNWIKAEQNGIKGNKKDQKDKMKQNGKNETKCLKSRIKTEPKRTKSNKETLQQNGLTENKLV